MPRGIAVPSIRRPVAFSCSAGLLRVFYMFHFPFVVLTSASILLKLVLFLVTFSKKKCPTIHMILALDKLNLSKRLRLDHFPQWISLSFRFCQTKWRFAFGSHFVLVQQNAILSTSTLSITRQSSFDLWLLLCTWPLTWQSQLETSHQAGHICLSFIDSFIHASIYSFIHSFFPSFSLSISLSPILYFFIPFILYSRYTENLRTIYQFTREKDPTLTPGTLWPTLSEYCAGS